MGVSALPEDVLEHLLGYVVDRRKPFWWHPQHSVVLQLRRVCRRWDRAVTGGHTWAVVTDWDALLAATVTSTAVEWILQLDDAGDRKLPPPSSISLGLQTECVRLGVTVTASNTIADAARWLATLLLPSQMPRLRSLHLFVSCDVSPQRLEHYVQHLVRPLVLAALDANLPDLLVDIEGHTTAYPCDTDVHNDRWWGAAGGQHHPPERRLGWRYAQRPGFVTPSVRALREDLMRAAVTQTWDVLSLPSGDLGLGRLPRVQALEITEGGSPANWSLVAAAPPHQRLRIDSHVHFQTWTDALLLPPAAATLCAVPWLDLTCGVHNEHDVARLGAVVDERCRQCQHVPRANHTVSLSVFWGSSNGPPRGPLLGQQRLRCAQLDLSFHGIRSRPPPPTVAADWGRWMSRTFDVRGELVWSGILCAAFLNAWQPASTTTHHLEVPSCLLRWTPNSKQATVVDTGRGRGRGAGPARR